MTEEEKETVRQIHFYCYKLKATANLVFARNDCSDLKIVLQELKELYDVCIESNG